MSEEHLFPSVTHVCTCAKFNKAYFCLSMIEGLVQNSFDSFLSIFTFLSIYMCYGFVWP